jgi:hypothetical protein
MSHNKFQISGCDWFSIMIMPVASGGYLLQRAELPGVRANK